MAGQTEHVQAWVNLTLLRNVVWEAHWNSWNTTLNNYLTLMMASTQVVASGCFHYYTPLSDRTLLLRTAHFFGATEHSKALLFSQTVPSRRGPDQAADRATTFCYSRKLDVLNPVKPSCAKSTEWNQSQQPQGPSTIFRSAPKLQWLRMAVMVGQDQQPFSVHPGHSRRWNKG